MVRIKHSDRGVEKGKRFGAWTVLGCPFSAGWGQLVVVVQCECGRIHVVRCIALRYGKSTQCSRCGAANNGGSKATRGTPGHAITQRQPLLYNCWKNMKERCENPLRKGFSNYGGRGIRVCDEWRSSFIKFVDWAIANGYRKGLEIDRIINDGNYEPGNCRFVTRIVNSRNRRTNTLLTAFGETKCYADWADDPRCRVNKGVLSSRIRQGWGAEQAITKPSRTSGLASSASRVAPATNR
jgi:hypothetical protein